MKKLTLADLPKIVLIELIGHFIKEPEALFTQEQLALCIVGCRFNKGVQLSKRALKKEATARKTSGKEEKQKLLNAAYRDKVRCVQIYESTKKMAVDYKLTDWLDRLSV